MRARKVNIGFLDANGDHRSMQYVPVVQDGDDAPSGPFVKWMPYQIGQARKEQSPATTEPRPPAMPSPAGAAVSTGEAGPAMSLQGLQGLQLAQQHPWTEAEQKEMQQEGLKAPTADTTDANQSQTLTAADIVSLDALLSKRT